MGTTHTTQPVLTPAIPSTYDVMNRDGVLMVVTPHDGFHAIKSAAMHAMITLELLAEGRITLEGSADTIQRDIADLKAIWDMSFR